MQETNERLLTDSSAENNLTISPVDNFAFARILSLLDQELISLSAVQIEDGLTATGKQVKVIKGTSRILGMMVPVTITLGEDAGLPFAFLDCEVSGVDLFQLGKTLIPFNIESFKEVSLPFFPKLSLHAAARSGLNSEYLKITAQVPDVWNPLGLEGFSLKDISLNALKEISPISLRYLHSAIFEASLVIKDKVVPVAVTIPLGAKGWRIKVAPSTILPSLADLVGLIAGDDVVNALPEAIRDLPSLKINTLDISFDPGIPRLLALTLDVASAGSWQLCSELSVETVQLQLNMVYDSSVARFPYAVSGRISGKMRVGRLYFLASVPYPLNGTTFLETGTVSALPSLGELFSLIGLDDFSAVLPKGIAESGAMNIESLGVALNLQEQQLERFNIAVKAANKWPLLPGKIEIINFGLGLTIDRQNTSWGISGRIYGTASIFNTLVSISCGRNTSNDNWDFYLMAPLTLPDIGTIAELTDTATVFDQLFPADSLFRQLQLTIGKFAITLDKENGHLSAFRLGIQMPSTVTILQEILSIADIELKVDIIEPFDSTRRKISGYLAGTITFAAVSARISCTLEEGMVLTGTIPAMQLSSMVKALTGKELAGEIPDVKCKEIYFSINTVTKAWSFKGKANADWDYANNGTPLHAELDIDIAKLSGGAVTARINMLVSGDVIICNDCKLHQLDLGFELKENQDWSASGSLKALLLGYEMSLQAAYQSNTLSLSWSGAENNEKKYVPLIASEGIGVLGCSTLGLTISKQGAAATASLALEATGILSIDNYFTLRGAIVFRKDTSGTVTMGFHANMDTRQVDDNADIRLDIIIPSDKQATSLSGAIREIDINKLAQLFLGKTALPAELPAVSFQDLSFSLKPYEGSFSFSGAAKVDWTFAEGQQELHSLASLSVARTKNADGQLKIQGALKTSFTGEFAVIEHCNFQSFQLDILLGQLQSPEIEGHARISLYDHQLDAVAGYKDNSLRLTADLHQLQLLNIDGVAGLEVDKLSFIYKRQQGNTSAAWEMDATAAIKIEHLGSLAGTVQLFSSAERSGLKVTNTSAPLTISLPVPDQQLAFQFGFDHFSVFKTVTAGVSGWQMEAGLDFGIKGLPEKFCQLFGEKDRVKFQTTLRLQDGSFHIHLDKLIGPVAIPIPDIEKEGKPVSLGTAYLLISDLDIQLGSEMGLSIVGGLRIPAALDHIFGDLSQPFFNAFDPAKPDETTVRLKLGILGSKVEVKLLSSPIAAVKMENGWVKVDLGDCGKFRFTPPVFSLNGTSFAAAISVERESELAIPVSLLKKLLINKLQLDKVASLLPDKIPISNIRFFDDDRKLLIGPFIEALAPDGEVKDLLEAAIDAVNKSVAYLPDRLVNNYMQFSIPEQFHAKISVTGTGNVELSVGVGEHSDPIRVLYPMMVGPLPALGGMELRNLSFGSLFGGSLFSLALDATFDQFDILSLGAAAIAGWLPEASRQLLPDTRKFQQTLTISDLYAIIVYQTVVPIPIPLFYKHVGMDHYGLEGLHVHAHISFPKPEADLAEVFRILQNLKRFFTDPVYQLPESDEELPKHVNLVFTFEDSYIMLPGYLGGAVAGKKQGQLVRINAAKIIAKVLNTIKFFSLRRLIEAIPVEYRIAHITSAGHSRLLDFNFELAYALTTPGEYAGKQAVIQSLQLANETIDHFFTQPLPANTEGIVFLGKGNIELWNTLKMSAHLGIIAVKDKGFVTHLQFYGAISDLLELSAKGIVKVDKQDHQNPVLLSGEVHVRSSLFQGHEVLSAVFEYKNIEGKDYFVFDGFLNLFPEHLPVKLESVTRVHCMWSNDYFNISHAATTLTLPVFGTFNAQTTILISDNRQEFYTIVSLNSRQVTLQIRNQENEFLLRGEFDAFQIGSILRITDFNDTFEDGRYKGAEIFILTDKVAGKLRVFYLDGRVTFLGLHAGVRIVVMDNAWSFSLSEGLRINRLQSSFLLNCTMAPDLGRFDGNAIFSVGLDLSISKKSFWIWFFGWHEIVVFSGFKWYGGFEGNLSIKVYNPDTYASTFDYDRELDIVVENIAINIAEMARKQQELDEKKNSVSKKHDEIKDHTAKREEVLKRIKELQPKLLNMQYIYRLFEAREGKGSGDEWLPAYNYAWNTFEAAAVDYLDTLSMLGYSTEDQLSFYMEQLAYLDKVYDYIAAYGHRSWGYNMSRIRQVLETGQAPDYDIVLQFVLKVDGLKKAHMRKYRIVYTPAPGANEMIQLQERCTNLNILDYLFDAREKKGSDPDWGNDYNRARTELMTAVNAYIAWVENQGWNSEVQYALLSSRLSFLDKIKENTAVYGSQLFGYTLDGINRAIETADTSQNDIVYQLMYEVEMAKRDAFNRQLGLKKFEYTAVVGKSVENGFGYNAEYHQEDVENGLLNTDEGIYEFLEKEIISYQIVIRKLQEQEKAIRAKRAQIEAARGQSLRFELQLQMGLNINGYELSLPDISILVAPEKLEDILGNVSGHVVQLVKDNFWNLVIDLFTGRGIRSRSLRGEGELPSLKYSYIRHGDTTVHRGGQRRLMMQERTPPPEGYDPEYDLTVYIE